MYCALVVARDSLNVRKVYKEVPERGIVIVLVLGTRHQT